MNVLAILLFLGVAAGVAWPFLAGKRGLVRRRVGTMESVPAAAGAAVGDMPDQLPALTGHKEQLCPQCGKVNAPGRRLCGDCNGELPYENVRDGINSLWKGK